MIGYTIGLVCLILFMIFMHYATDRYSYIACVTIYAVGRGLIPSVIPF